MFKLLFSRTQTLLIVCPLVLFSCTNQANRALFIDEQYSHAVDAVKHLGNSTSALQKVRI